MALSKDDILEGIANLSVMEVVELVSAMETKFGVSADAAVAVADATPAAENEAPTPSSATSVVPATVAVSASGAVPPSTLPARASV